MRRNLTRGALWLGATRIMVSVIGFSSTIVLARLLAPADFGIVAVATSLLALVTALTELSMANALIHHQDPEPDHFHTAWTLNAARSALILLAFAIMSPLVATATGDTRLGPVLMVTGLTGALSGLGSPKTVTMTRKLIFWQEFLIQVTQKLGGFVISIPIAVVTHSYWALTLGNLASTVIALGLSYVVCPYLPRPRLTKHKELLHFSVWLTFCQVINTLNWRFDQLMLGFFLGKPQLGVYSVASNLSAIPTREATLPIAQTLFPAMASVRSDPDRLRAVYQRAQALMCALAMPVGVGFAIIGPALVQLLMGPKWIAAGPVIQVLAVSFALGILCDALQPLAMAQGATRMLFGREVRVFVIRMPFLLGGLWLGGLTGVVWGCAISNFISQLMNMDLVRRLSGISVRAQFAANWRTLTGIAMMLGVTSGLKMVLPPTPHPGSLVIELVALIVSGALVYGSTVAALWIWAGRPDGPESELGRMASRFGIRAGH